MKKVILDEICKIKGRIGFRGYAKKDIVERGQGAISLSPSNIKDNKLDFSKNTYISWEKYNESPEIMVYPGDIIFCKTASIGKTAFIENLPEKATLNPQLVVLKDIKCSGKFLSYYLGSNFFKQHVKRISAGSSIPTLTQKNLGKLEIFLPTKEEQKKIVSILDATQKLIDNINIFILILNNLEKALFEDTYSNPNNIDQSTLGELVNIKRGGSPRPINKWLTDSDDGINWIKISDATKSIKYITKTKQKIKREGIELSRMVKEGDFILSNSMSYGRPYIMKTEGCIHDGWLLLRDDKNIFDQDFLYSLLSSSHVINQFKLLAIGAVVKNLNIKAVSKVKVKIPQIYIQKKFAKEIRIIENIKNKILDKLKLVNNINENIKYKSFNKNLNV